MEKGIDISYWQGNVDFAKVAGNADFIILREGFGTAVDRKFLEYVKGCKKNGIPVRGVYHFCYSTSVAGAKAEAAECIRNIERAGLGKDTIVFFDFEYDTVETAKKKGITLGKAECISFTKAFCSYVEEHGYKAGIYANLDYYKRMYDKDLIGKYVFWLADYSGNPDVPCSYHQYTSGGKVPGINGKVDMNYCYDSKKKKTVAEIACEVIAGEWGNGEDRKEALEKAGYNYEEVRAKVNKLVGSSSKTVAEVAKEVVAGKWGNGIGRKKKLEAAGYDYEKVQVAVNKLLK